MWRDGVSGINRIRRCIGKVILAAALLPSAGIGLAQVQLESFHPGPLIPEYGPIAHVDGATPLATDAAFKVSFDVAAQASPGNLNRSLSGGARFLNMHAQAGVDPARMELAFVIHGPAVHDVTTAEHYAAINGDEEKNANAALVAALIKQGVKIYVCGQSAAYQGVGVEDLLPGVEMALSAMTAHALLQQAGYTLNPF